MQRLANREFWVFGTRGVFVERDSILGWHNEISSEEGVVAVVKKTITTNPKI
jgi:hypothetical protein